MSIFTDDPALLAILDLDEKVASPLAKGAPDWLAGLLPGCGSGPGGGWIAPGPEPGPFWDHHVLVKEAPQSQYDELRRLSGDPGNLACLALGGSNFHGQHGRPWQTLPGNFHWSGRVRLDLDAEQCGRALVALPALAVLDLLDPLQLGNGAGAEAGRPGIKWVNDILWQGRKVAGVLTAARSQGGRLESVVFGVGINVAAAPQTNAPRTGPGATCLAHHLAGRTPTLATLYRGYALAITRRVRQLETQGPSSLLADYRHRSLVLGRRVGIWPSGTGDVEFQGPPLHEGRVLEILPDLSLRLAEVPHPVSSGRLVLL